MEFEHLRGANMAARVMQGDSAVLVWEALQWA
jgi:hypothetical protein